MVHLYALGSAQVDDVMIVSAKISTNIRQITRETSLRWLKSLLI